jgi:hypothetical protein
MKKLSHTFPLPELGVDRFCRITTIGEAGQIRATATVYREEDRGTYKTESHVVYQDYCKGVFPAERVKRVTAKAVAELHADAVGMESKLRADIIAHYAKGDQA